ncbi:unnamed protein product [Ixodes hexagonus]
MTPRGRSSGATSGLTLLLLVCACASSSAREYYARWDHLDSRPLPAWFDQAKVGVLLYWGVFSVPSFGSEWLWYHWKGRQNSVFSDFMRANYRPNITYQEFASQFTCEFYSPEHWVDLLQRSGVKYVVFTAKHFEGYTLWPSKYSWNWNSLDVGPQKDLLGDFARVLRATSQIKLGVYYSLYEWFNPLFLDDREANYKTNEFVKHKVAPELRDMVRKYEPELVWSDGDWEAPESYWESTKFLAWLYSNSTVRDTVVTNDRWGKGLWCKHGDFKNCKDGFNPKILQKRKFENVMTLDKLSWGFRRNAKLRDFLSDYDLVRTLVETVSCGGNLLVTLGPTHDGRIPLLFEERLVTLGQWLSLHGDAVFGSRPWVAQNDSVSGNVWYTSSDIVPTTESAGTTTSASTPSAAEAVPLVYAFLLGWPASGLLRLGSIALTENSHLSLVGAKQKLSWKPVGQMTIVNLPTPPVNVASRVGVWAVRMSGVQPAPTHRPA